MVYCNNNLTLSPDWHPAEMKMMNLTLNIYKY